MPMQRVTITRELRRLIRLTRTDRAGLTQKAAAEAAGGLSEIWWKQIETRAEYATADVLARMCYAIRITPDQLRRIDQDHIADLVQERHEYLDEPEPAEDMETYLLATPGLTPEQRQVLLATARALRGP